MKSAAHIPLLLCLFAGAAYAGPGFSSILAGGGQEYAAAVTSDPQGNVYVAGLTYSPDFPVTAGAAQTRFGGTCDAFVAKLGPDGKVIWSTYLGGILDDFATGVALDSAGNVLVTGYTRSPDFPLLKPILGTYNNGASDLFDAFVAKLDPNGAKLLYSTFLGGAGNDGAAGIVTDAAANAYVAVTVQSAAGFPGLSNAPDQPGIVVSKLNPQGGLSYSSFHPGGSAAAIALDGAGSIYVAGSSSSVNPSTTQAFGPPGRGSAIVFKISSDGSKKIFETALRGSVKADATAVAVNRAGEVYLAGNTSSVDFPLARPIQSSPGARPLWKSVDGGSTWTPMDDLPFAIPRMLVVDPTATDTLYEATGDLGVFKSLDGGVTWTRATNGIASSNIQTMAIDPVHPQTLYAATAPAESGGSSAVYKTVNGGAAWTLIDSPPSLVSQLAVDAQNPAIVWEIGISLRKSVDAGATWNPVAFPGNVESMALDPRVSGNVFAASSLFFCGSFCSSSQLPYLYRSVNGGADWIQSPSPAPALPGLIVDGSTSPSTVYNGLASRSVDGGVTWTPITPPPGTNPSSGFLTVDPGGTLYAVTARGLFVSRDHAQTWTATGALVPANIVTAGSGGTLYANIFQPAVQPPSSGFVTKLSADGASIVYSTYLRGHTSLDGFSIFAAEPGAFTTQNWIASIAVDGSGNATVAGGTRGNDFPSMVPAQAASGGLADAFAATLSADGSRLSYATYFGGSQDDGALAAALDAQGDLILAGQTWSSDFPVPGGSTLPFSFGNAFVVRLPAPGPPAITAVLNAASFQAGIEAGSWVMIQGSNLANTFPGRTWRKEEVGNGSLPTSLDGVSVTIDGKPAFVYYISPTQINVQAPSDGAIGTVNVVVANNGRTSAPAAANLQPAAPAFFMIPGTNGVVASRLPDYALVGDPSAVPGAVAARPGDTVVLWGTGFGATNPAAPAGAAVIGAPAVVSTPTVTVGGAPAAVIDAVLTSGSAGLYQVTIRLPAAMPLGEAPVRASVGGVQTQAGVVLFVDKQ